VAFILNILSAMFYVFEEINCRWCSQNTVPVVVTYQEYRE